MSDYHQNSRLEGYHKITFDKALSNGGWDLAYDLDGYMKTIDRPDVPRLLPHIRLNKHGHPATATHEENGRQIPKTLASIYFPQHNWIVKAIYDPNYQDPNYRYKLERYDSQQYFAGVANPEESDTYGELEYLLKAFYKSWVEEHFPKATDHMERHRRGFAVPEEYVAKGYGLFG